jgi:hypothetical protein
MDPQTGVFVKKEFQTASRNVRQYLEDLGYNRGQQNNITPDPLMISRRHEYVQALVVKEVLAKGQRLRNVNMNIIDSSRKTFQRRRQ